jgi:Xaa-Pro aminopeptidase
MKLKAFQSYLQEQNIDFAFLSHPDLNITYFTQIKPSFAYLIITPKKAFFYLTELDKKPILKEIKSYFLKKGWQNNIKKIKPKQIGINQESLTVASLERLKKHFPKAQFVDISPKLQELRQQKTQSEIEKLAQACAITTYAFNATITELTRKTLHTEQDVALFLEKKIREQGGDIGFPTIIAMGKNAATPHHITSTAKLQRGFLLFDFGASYQNYCADMSRTLFLGTPNEQEKQVYNLLLNAQEKAIDAVKENLPLAELDKVARKNLGKYSSRFIHSLGHGIGLEVHEAPNFVKDPKNTIKEDVPFTIEPGIYIQNKLGLRIEDTLLLHQGKIIVLTKAPKKLISIPTS